MRLDHDPSVEEQQPVKQSFCRSLRRDTHWKCLILTLLICGCLAAITWCRMTVVPRVAMDFYQMTYAHGSASPCEDGYIYIPVAFVVMLYLVYLVECWHCHTRIELHCKVDVNTIYEHIQAMREAIPIVWWKAVCYHYVRRTRQVTRYRNGDAFTTTQVYYERVNSHTATTCFNFTACGIKDFSRNLVNLEAYPATKIKFSKGFSFATVDAEQEFEDQRVQFFQDHERRDDYMETREGLDLMNINFKEHMIAFADPDNLPWYVSHGIFWVSSLLMLSWPLRVLIEFKTAHVRYHVHKLFGCNYLDSSYCLGQMTRVSTMGSSELEMNIRSNYTLVPSYSEALLMDGMTSRPAVTLVATPNGSIPMVPLSSQNNAQANGYLSNYQLPNGHAGGNQVNDGFGLPGGGYQNGGLLNQQNGYVPRMHNGHIPNAGQQTEHVGIGVGAGSASSRRQVDSSPSDSAPVHHRRRRRKRKRRRQSYAEATASAQSDSDSTQRPSSTSQSAAPSTSSPPSVHPTPHTSTPERTPDSISELDTGTLPSGESCYEVTEEASHEHYDEPSTSPPRASASAVLHESPPPYEAALAMSIADQPSIRRPQPPTQLPISNRVERSHARAARIARGSRYFVQRASRDDSVSPEPRLMETAL